ncbi:MAG: hypothetical protein ACKVXR_19080, partial [Planctomycetota bacterium]
MMRTSNGVLTILFLTVLSTSCSHGSAADTPAAFDEARAWRDLEAIVALGPRPPGSEALEKQRKMIED